MAVHDFASEEDLLDGRLTAQPHDLVFLVGSAVTAPGRTGEPGVPRVDGVIDRRSGGIYSKPEALARFEQALAEQPTQRYQAAFRHLQRTRGQDLANAIIRRCVLQARVASPQFPAGPRRDRGGGASCVAASSRTSRAGTCRRP
jgi:hypothetical protein